MSRDRQEQRLHIRDVCGKQGETANLQGLLIHVSKGIAVYGERLKGFGGLDKETGLFVAKGLFSTLMNVN